ncbi:hypothetical protein K438DRAFT_1798988 [Mycena galopus ATCC 62051]|nr:hypothetical protein K438DRAFT_1798988 [Mycena galopus ATCC 62051]
MVDLGYLLATERRRRLRSGYPPSVQGSATRALILYCLECLGLGSGRAGRVRRNLDSFLGHIDGLRTRDLVFVIVLDTG